MPTTKKNHPKPVDDDEDLNADMERPKPADADRSLGRRKSSARPFGQWIEREMEDDPEEP